MLLKNLHLGTLEKAEICKHKLWVQKISVLGRHFKLKLTPISRVIAFGDVL